MASRSYELEPADEITVTAVGEPGSRQFFLLARASGGETVTLACEKFHIEGLIARARELLEAHGLPSSPDRRAKVAPAEPGDPEWAIAELGLGYHEARKQFVIVAREEPSDSEEEAATARFWTGPEAIRRFMHQAAGVLAQGRATCPRCGLPVDPAGHPCPALNGSRPIF